MKRILITCLSIAVMAFATMATVHAQWGGGYDLAWSTIDGGGGSSSGGGYTLNGTVGQADAGALGGEYTLSGGFWSTAGVSTLFYRVYLPTLLR